MGTIKMARTASISKETASKLSAIAMAATIKHGSHDLRPNKQRINPLYWFYCGCVAVGVIWYCVGK